MLYSLLGTASTSLAQWQSLNGGVNHLVRCFAESSDGTRLLIGGSFPYVWQDSLRANGLAWWDGQAWSIEGLAGGDGDTSVFGSNNPVVSLSIRPDTIFGSYLAGQWQHSTALRYASMLVDGTWQACGSPESTFLFMEANGRLFNGGRADTLYGEFKPMVNEWIGGAWQSVPGYSFSTTGLVTDVEYWQGQYYFGGIFNAFGSRKMVAFDGVDQWTPLGGGVGGNFVSTVCGYGDSLYVGGFFLPGPDVQSKHLQIWDGQAWHPFFPQVEFVGTVADMQVHEGALYIAGVHTWAGDTTWYGLLRYDGNQLCSIGGPMPSGDNGPMFFFQDNLYLGISPMFPSVPNEFVAYLPLDGLVPDTCVAVSSTAVSERHAQQRLIVLPNPATDHVTLRWPASIHGAMQLLLFDEVGREVFSQMVQGESDARLMLSPMAPGHYTLVLQGHDATLRGQLTIAR